MKMRRSSATRAMALVRFVGVQKGQGAGFVPLMAMWKGDQGPRISGDAATEMLFGPGVFGHGFAGLRVRHGDTNGPQEVLLVCGAPSARTCCV